MTEQNSFKMKNEEVEAVNEACEAMKAVSLESDPASAVVVGAETSNKSEDNQEEASSDDEQPTCIWDHLYKFAEVKILIHEDYDAGLGGTMFDGALCLSNYIEYLTLREKVSFKSKKVIELGAGCGLPGLLMAALGAKVDITDIEQTIELIEENIESNEEVVRASGTGSATARVLDWTSKEDKSQFESGYDFILAADTVYSKECILPYLDTLKVLSDEKTQILFAHPAPRKPEASEYFWSVVTNEFTVEKLETAKFVPGNSKGFLSPTNGVFILKLKPGSQAAS